MLAIFKNKPGILNYWNFLGGSNDFPKHDNICFFFLHNPRNFSHLLFGLVGALVPQIMRDYTKNFFFGSLFSPMSLILGAFLPLGFSREKIFSLGVFGWKKGPPFFLVSIGPLRRFFPFIYQKNSKIINFWGKKPQKKIKLVKK